MIAIGVIGRSWREGESLAPHILETAEAVGRGVAEAGAALISGGTGGVMEAACKGAFEAGGLTVGFLPYADRAKANPYLTLAFPTGMGTIRNVLTARCCDAIVMVGGGVGTLNEVTIAYDSGVPTVVIEGTTGWADRLRSSIEDGQWLDDRHVTPLTFVSDPASAVSAALERAREPRHGSRLGAFTGWAGQ
ncbi:TIGR00725 family protein [Herbiconiux moechotypicola]|uniref:TIGR00725 family protein n=1 Tax=Herbiconiux moechotypicola TaxID=637393 RepID=A0ABP5Q9H3_9MICO|nr:TIGR00725 family protein [Herbiconiux moechotypicola]MCS5729328.1 TIGR00725 family protein [Herbiconiux moechotypicola]